MSDDDNPSIEADTNNWLATVFEGGLPQILLGPAGKAISRLIGAGVEIPAAYLDGLAQDIRDKSDARSAITQAIAERAKSQAVGDPAVMERAINSMLSRSYRAQLNKDGVAKVAVEDLSGDPPSPDNAGPSDDWMDKFERHAEEAGSVDLQFLFGKILAGEIRQPGAIGPAALHFVSMLDGFSASLIDKVLPYTLPFGVTLLAAMPDALKDAEISLIEQSGFFTAGKTYNPKTDSTGRLGDTLGNDDYYIVYGKKDVPVGMGAAGMVSIAGRGLLNALKPKLETSSICNQFIKSPNVQRVEFGTGFLIERGFEIPDPTVIENPDFVEE